MNIKFVLFLLAAAIGCFSASAQAEAEWNVRNGFRPWTRIANAKKSLTPEGLKIQFSITGSEWHDTATEADIYIRFSVDGGTQWTTAARYQGKSA